MSNEIVVVVALNAAGESVDVNDPTAVFVEAETTDADGVVTRFYMRNDQAPARVPHAPIEPLGP